MALGRGLFFPTPVTLHLLSSSHPTRWVAWERLCALELPSVGVTGMLMILFLQIQKNKCFYSKNISGKGSNGKWGEKNQPRREYLKILSVFFPASFRLDRMSQRGWQMLAHGCISGMVCAVPGCRLLPTETWKFVPVHICRSRAEVWDPSAAFSLCAWESLMLLKNPNSQASVLCLMQELRVDPEAQSPKGF